MYTVLFFEIEKVFEIIYIYIHIFIWPKIRHMSSLKYIYIYYTYISTIT